MLYVVPVTGWCRWVARVLYRCFLEARPVIQGIFLLRFLAGASFAGHPFAEEVNLPLWAGAGLWACTTSSIYILNGVMDVEEDQINGSSRPIASGKLPVTQATWVTVSLTVLSVVGSFALGSSMVWSVVALLALGWLYSGPPLYLKRSPAGWAVFWG
jgi:4-hydroxybenzoate polyprenyltransferase